MEYSGAAFCLVVILNHLAFSVDSSRTQCWRGKKNSTSKVIAYVGTSVLLNCSTVLISPDDTPSNFTWLKFGQPLHDVTFRSMNSVFRYGRAMLWLRHVLLADAGVYSCLKITRVKTEKITFNLSVRELNAREPPTIIGTLLVNQSITLRQTVVLECQIISGTTPYITWYFQKAVNTSMNNSTTLDNKIILKKPRRVPFEDGSLLRAGRDGTEHGGTGHDRTGRSFKDLLYKYNVTFKDTGTYYCLGFNKHGKALKQVVLTVLPEPTKKSLEEIKRRYATKFSEPSKVPVIILIALPGGLFVISCAIVLRSYEKNRRAKLKMAADKREVASKPNDVIDNKVVAMETQQNWKPVGNELARANVPGEQRYDSMSTSSVSEIEVIITGKKTVHLYSSVKAERFYTKFRISSLCTSPRSKLVQHWR